MNISKEELSEIAGNFLDMLNDIHVENTKDLEQMVSQEQKVNFNGDFIEFYPGVLLRYGMGVGFPGVRYIRKGEMEQIIPIEIKIDKSFGESVILLTMQKSLEGYEIIGSSEGNFVQGKLIRTADFSEFKKELKYLSELS